MELDVVWSHAARNDLYTVYDWIAGQADVATAVAYTARIDAFASKLSYFPNRGTPRFGVASGLRSITFERRYIVAYRVEPDCVWIVRLIDTARDFRRAFGSTTRWRVAPGANRPGNFDAIAADRSRRVDRSGQSRHR